MPILKRCDIGIDEVWKSGLLDGKGRRLRLFHFQME